MKHVKVLLMGGSKVGKTAFRKCFFSNEDFDEKFLSKEKVVQTTHPYNQVNTVENIIVWDCAGYMYDSLSQYIESTHIAILVYDSTNLNSLQNLTPPVY